MCRVPPVSSVVIFFQRGVLQKSDAIKSTCAVILMKTRANRVDTGGTSSSAASYFGSYRYFKICLFAK